MKGDLSEKLGQIAHLDQDWTNNAEDNLAWICFEHHGLNDSKTKQHKNYTIHEVKASRAKLYDLVAAGKHLVLSPTTSKPETCISSLYSIARSEAYFSARMMLISSEI